MDKLLTEAFEQAGFTLNDKQKNQLITYYQLLIQWNQRINLTAIEEEQDVVYKHFLDSALFFKASGKVDHLSLLDVGTGAGFPGVVLKIMAPTLSVCLLDSLNKRVDFLQKLTATLQLEDISAIHGRAEEWGHKATYRQQFDLVTARAVARLSVLNELCLPFIKVGGRFIALKGPELNNELADAERGIALLGAQITDIIEWELADTFKRNIIVMTKTANTPQKYPRRAGTPQKTPL